MDFEISTAGGPFVSIAAQNVIVFYLASPHVRIIMPPKGKPLYNYANSQNIAAVPDTYICSEPVEYLDLNSVQDSVKAPSHLYSSPKYVAFNPLTSPPTSPGTGKFCRKVALSMDSPCLSTFESPARSLYVRLITCSSTSSLGQDRGRVG